MKKIVNENYFDIIKGKGIFNALPLFLLYIKESDELNRVCMQKREVADRLGVSERSVGNYVRILSNIDVIKYKYSGAVRINPKYYFNGRIKDYKKALSEYEGFRNDI